MNGGLLIVDGYNVIHSLERYRAPREAAIESAVQSLLADLIDLAAANELEVVLVLDGRGEGSQARFGGVKVVYSRAGQSADSFIERLAYRGTGSDQAVCTSDHAQQKAVSRPGTRVMTPKHLGAMIEEQAVERTDRTAGAYFRPLEERLPESMRKRLDDFRRGV
jgi:predicted RNA-binding protein with PIN domain